MEKALQAEPKLDVLSQTADCLSLRISGCLDANTVAKIWDETVNVVRNTKARELVLDVSGVDPCDMAGIGLFSVLKTFQENFKFIFKIDGLRPEYKNLFDLVCQRNTGQPALVPPREDLNSIEKLGRWMSLFLEDLYDQMAFVGEVLCQFLYAVRNPRSIRWKDVLVFIGKAGADAVPLIAMVGFLIGVIMAFQSAIPLRQMGSDLFVADIVAFAVLRELGPLVTAIILAGRTGSAIAAEIGTMKINEEINALTTMGLEPVRFLVTSRIIGVLLLMPLLIVCADFFGMIGGAVIFQFLGHPLPIYVNQITNVVGIKDIVGGILKAFPFGLTVVGVGCLRGLRTKTGASAVGDSTTSSVVTGMVLIIILDGIISTLYYFLGI